MKKLIFLSLMALNFGLYSADFNPFAYYKKKAETIFEKAKKDLNLPKEIILEEEIDLENDYILKYMGKNYYEACPKLDLFDSFHKSLKSCDMCYLISFIESRIKNYGLTFMLPEKIFNRGYDYNTGKLTFVMYVSPLSLNYFKSQPIYSEIYNYFVDKVRDYKGVGDGYIMISKVIPVKVIATVNKKLLDKIDEIEKSKSSQTMIRAKL